MSTFTWYSALQEAYLPYLMHSTHSIPFWQCLMRIVIRIQGAVYAMEIYAKPAPAFLAAQEVETVAVGQGHHPSHA
jgi:hypothetical protein